MVPQKSTTKQPTFGVQYNYNPLIQCIRHIEIKCLNDSELTVERYYEHKNRYLQQYGQEISYILKISVFKEIEKMPRMKSIAELHRELFSMKRIANDYIWG